MSAAIAGELTCKELVELVTDYFEDRLHVCSCTGCRAYLAQMRVLVRAAGRLAERDLPVAARENLLTAFRAWKRA